MFLFSVTVNSWFLHSWSNACNIVSTIIIWGCFWNCSASCATAFNWKSFHFMVRKPKKTASSVFGVWIEDRPSITIWKTLTPTIVIVGMGPTIVFAPLKRITGYKWCSWFIVMIAISIWNWTGWPWTGGRFTGILILGTTTSMKKKRWSGACLFGILHDGEEHQGARRNRRGHSNNAGAHQLLRFPRRTVTNSNGFLISTSLGDASIPAGSLWRLEKIQGCSC